MLTVMCVCTSLLSRKIMMTIMIIELLEKGGERKRNEPEKYIMPFCEQDENDACR